MIKKFADIPSQTADRPEKIRRKPERPAEILAAAFEEFVQSGYAATRLEDVARRAGVTKGTIYFHFQNKDQVFIQMVRELSKPVVLMMEEFIANKPADIVEFVEAYLAFSHGLILEDRYAREILRLLISEATRFPELVDEYFAQFMEPVFAHLGPGLTEGAKAGKIRSSPIVQFPDLLLSPVLALHIYLLLFSDRRPLDAKLHLEAARDLFLYGLLPRS